MCKKYNVEAKANAYVSLPVYTEKNRNGLNVDSI